ncbi:MAG: hypothetical protein ACOCXP_01320 [Candidatus Dojkabacteria bacterium]
MTNTASIVKTSSNVFSFSLFFGMALVAFLTLIALSPVSYERYSAYLDQQNNSRNNSGQVAGVGSEDLETIEVFNLLNRSEIPFQFNQTEESSLLSARFNEGTLKHKYEWNQLLKVRNNGFSTQTIYVRFDSRVEAAGIVYDLHSPEGNLERWGSETYILSVSAGNTANLVMLREAENTLNPEPLFEPFTVTIQTSLEPFVQDQVVSELP